MPRRRLPHQVHIELTDEEMERLKRCRAALLARVGRSGIMGQVTYKATFLAALVELETRIADWDRKR